MPLHEGIQVKKWIIVSNRLPFVLDEESKKIIPSSGGLVSSISGIKGSVQKIWVGSVQTSLYRSYLQESPKKRGFNKYIPIYVSDEDYDKYYNHISNDVLWPLFHYESHLVHFNRQDWDVYQRINLLFAQKIAKIADRNDLIWVHDFHLMLLPRFLRKLNPKLKIGFFLHTPFPTQEIFKQLPTAKEILQGILEANVIGFHEYSYLRHFRNSVQSILGIASNLFNIRYQERQLNMGVFPVSIDTDKFIESSNSNEVKKIVKKLKSKAHYDHLVLGVDRLDYTKGIDLKLKAFKEFLRQNQQTKDRSFKVSLLQIAVPTRRDIPVYMKLKEEIDCLVGEINGEFGGVHYTPVEYLYKSIPFTELTALYRMADALLVTSKRDGMNLVSLEYLAAQDITNPGVAILSEFTGAVSTLPHIILINPWDIFDTAEKISQALRLSTKEKIQKHRPMLQYLKNYTATTWAEDFMSSLDSVKLDSDREIKIIKMDKKKILLHDQIKRSLRKKKKLFMFLDYDGTLVPIKQRPEEAVFSRTEKEAIFELAEKKSIQMIIVSGRPKGFLRSQFRDIPVHMCAEHGALYYSWDQNKWISLVQSDIRSWYGMASKIMQSYTCHVPESFIEAKQYSISWHYRKSPKEFGSYQANRLKEELRIGLADMPVTVIDGKKVVEARCIEANKSNFIRWYLLNRLSEDNAQLMSVGDDLTDEEMFQAFTEETITVKVGEPPTHAKYLIDLQEHVLTFLQAVSRYFV